MTSSTKMMTALRAHTRGGPEQLAIEHVPIPHAGPGEVLVAVHAAAITFAELDWDLTWTTRDGTDRTPVIPSHEVSGTIAELGDGVTGFAVGDEVYGLIDFDRDGAAAEFAVVPADALTLKPRSVSHTEAAALPLAALTAWQALIDHAGLQTGERVLIHGGAGGVGVYAVQIAHNLGAHVVATDAPSHVDFLRGLGAGHVIDFTSERFVDVVSDLDVVLDTVGGRTLEQSFSVLRPGGRLVTLGAPPPPGAADEHKVRAVFFVVKPDQDELRQLASMVDEFALTPVVSQTYPLTEGREAYESGGLPRLPGKTVLVVR
jgi:NADPH:quinone reductase-like Zn-dependent oxidoreductase